MLLDLITSEDAATRDQALASACASLDASALLAECSELDAFRRDAASLYDRVRALFFLSAIHRYHLPEKIAAGDSGSIPFSGYEDLLGRRFEEAIDTFIDEQNEMGASDAISSALASAYHQLAFQTLADQVRKSVRTVRGNQWMFRMGHPADQPLRIRPELLEAKNHLFPVLRELTPVRMDLTHSAWSDIFFLGMDFPEGARVINVSIDLAVHGRDDSPTPPVEAYLRVIDKPVLRLNSIDLKTSAEIDSLAEVFDFGKDYLGLLKAAVIASGIIPPGIEGSGESLADLLEQVVGPGKGLEVISSVNNIPKGSRLAVSTNLLAALISACMRATGQTQSLTGELTENERRLVLARAILGEWIGGSGGGWQDSGGVWPGIKLIEGEIAGETDPESGISKGRLMPKHKVFGTDEIPESSREALQNSLILVHGGMASNVGPILEMVTEKYLLRSSAEWTGRKEALSLLDQVLEALKIGDIQQLGALTTKNFRGPLQTIIPWATNHFTETLIKRAEEEFGDDFWGFWMLGGMSGGGMGFIVNPARKAEALGRLQEIMIETKRELENALPFAMDPVVYDFSINPHGTYADLLDRESAFLPPGYYQLSVSELLRAKPESLSPSQRAELDRFALACREDPRFKDSVQSLFDTLIPRIEEDGSEKGSLKELLKLHGFDSEQHEAIRRDLQNGRIGLAQNRLPANTHIEDVLPEDIADFSQSNPSPDLQALGEAALKNGEAAVITLAAGAGSRWTQGAGVCKALHPFSKFAGRHRTFIETHLAKSRKRGAEFGTTVPHIFTTSYLTNGPTADFLAQQKNYNYPGSLLLSPGRSVGQRMIPTERDLRFAWEELPQQTLDEQQQKMRESGRSALIGWASEQGEASDYTDNLPLQCLHPVGHFFEVPNLLLNGTLATLLKDRPQLKTLMLHNIDTLGADLDPGLLGHHLKSETGLSFEVITRRLEDRGGGLARVNKRPRLLEGLALPREEDEFALSYYNSMTTWIDLDQLLTLFGLTRDDIISNNQEKVTAGIREIASRLPTYITLKEVKKRWGHGQEDIFPVTQFEKLWGDLTTLPGIRSDFLVVPRLRGQQLKDPAQLDSWLRDGSANHIDSLCQWD
ncbi:UTP--glucose-1-phosphate uridylyltransferase [Akkermansiaceae bacterium]|nr:UTP--glucose-1-phosphate uridylyltransferase [Akkermansiaceae bacterium]MDB4392754.1 UTP--glucose-1-phosphate uridylyltransferase [Akkermansiaceae bacterium]